MTVTDKILHGLADVLIQEFYQHNNSSTKSNGLKLQKHHTRTNLKKYSFAARVLNDYNSLPSDIVMATNINSLKLCWIFIGMTINF